MQHKFGDTTSSKHRVIPGGITSEYFQSFILFESAFSVCLCESERGISTFGPALLGPSEQPGQSTQAQFGGSQHHLNCKENRKFTSGSVLTL